MARGDLGLTMPDGSATVAPVLAARGELDLATSRDLATQLGELAGAPGDAILDLSAVTFLDSMGLGVVLKGTGRFQRQGKLLVLVAPQGGQVARLLDFAGARERVTVEETVEAAQARIAARR